MTFLEILLIIVCCIIVILNVIKYIRDLILNKNTECSFCHNKNIVKEYKKWIIKNNQN